MGKRIDPAAELARYEELCRRHPSESWPKWGHGEKPPGDPLANAIAKLAVDVATELVREWHEHRNMFLDSEPTWDDTRGAVIYAFFEAFARRTKVWAAPLELVAPNIPAVPALKLRIRIDSELPSDEYLTPERFGAAHEALTDYGIVDGKVEKTGGRRKSGVHFTPRWMTRKVVWRTIEPIFRVIDANESASLEEKLFPSICDPAVGAGAFLVEAARQAGERVLAHGAAADIHEAKRLVAIRSLHGVDKCPFAVYATKLAIRLECRADHRMPATWLDENIKHGDALVGLSLDQIEHFHWDVEAKGARKIPEISEMLEPIMSAIVKARRARIDHLSQIARSA